MMILRFLALIVIFLASCGRDAGPSIEKRAASLLPDAPDSAIRVINGYFDKVGRESIPDRRLMVLHILRQRSFESMGDMDSVLEESFRIMQIARRIDDSLAFALSLLPLRGEFDESKFKYLEDNFVLAIGILSRRQLHREQAMLMSTHAAMLNNIGKYDESQGVAIAAISLPGSNERDSLRAHLYLTIANNYMGGNSNAKAFQFFRQALSLSRSLRDSVLLPGILLDMGILHYDIGSDSARDYYMEALRSIPTAGGKLQRMKILYNIAVEDFKEDRDREALAGFRNLLADSRADGMKMGEAVAYKALGFYHEANGRPDSAVYYLQCAVRMADSIQQPFLKIQSLIELEKAYRTNGDDEEAFRQHKVTDGIKDSMFSVDKEKMIHGLEMHFDTERKELEVENLRKSLDIRQGWMMFMGLLSVALAAVLWLARQRNRLWKERYNSYTVLMEQYKAERLAELAGESDHSAEPLARAGIPPSSDAKSVRTPAPPNPIYVELQHLFQVKKVFKDPKINIEDVAQWLNVSSRQISSAIRDREGLSFSQYVNRNRIREARRMIEDPDKAQLKLEAIGEMVGLPNRSYFQKVFESIVGVTPGHYRRSFLADAETVEVGQD